MKLEHVAINVPDPAKMAQWYVDNLDMILVRAVPGAPYMHFIADKNKESMIEIYNNVDAGVPNYANVHPRNLHFAFAVDNIEAARDRLVAAGATVVDDIEETAGGDRLLFLRDPWDVTIQFVHRKDPML